MSHASTTTPTAMALALAVVAPAITHGVNYYDVMDTIDEIVSPVLKASVTNSLAWSIDTAVINKARDVFYRLREAHADSQEDSAEESGIDKFNNFIRAIAIAKSGDQYGQDLGFEENTGALTELALLVSIRQMWHDKATQAAAVDKSKFTPKSLEELIASEKVRSVDDETRVKLSTLAEFASRGKPERVAQITADLIKLEQNKYVTQHKSRTLVAPAVINIIAMAEYRDIDSYRDEMSGVRFHQLAIETQSRLIKAARGAVERSITNLASRKGVSQFAFATEILPEAYDAMDKIDTVLNSPKFSD